MRGLVPDLPTRAWVILGGDALSALGSGLTLPFLLVYLHRMRGLDLGVAGLVLSVIAVAGLVGNPVGGILVDRWGARRTLVTGLWIAAAGSALIAAVHSPWQSFLAAGTYGLGMAVAWPAQDALLATVVTDAQRPQVFAMRHAAINAGFSVGGLLAASVVSFSAPDSFVLVYLLDAASFLAFALIVARLALPDPPPTPPGGAGELRYRRVLADRALVRVWVITLLLVTAGYAQFHAAFPAYATGAGGLAAPALALAFTANTLTVVLAQLVTLRLLAGRRRTRGVMLAATFMAGAWTMTLVGGTLGGVMLFAAAMVLFALGETLLSPTIPAIVNDLAPAELRGRYNGAYTLAWTGGYILGPAIAGLALGADHGGPLFAGLVSVLAGAAWLAWRLERRLPAAANLVAGQRRTPQPAEPVPALAVAEGAP